MTMTDKAEKHGSEGHARLRDFDTAYDNMKAVCDSSTYPPRWVKQAAAFRQQMYEDGRIVEDLTYSSGERHRYDLFLPKGSPKGTIVYVHGGYWKAFDKSFWSHLARGAVERGYRVAIPSYTLCPQARINEITREIGLFLDALAGEVEGDISLAGHSAGGHLVSRMACKNAPVSDSTATRIQRVLSISGLHDLRPLLKTAMNDIFRMAEAEAAAESAALLQPRDNMRVFCCVGADELAEFRRQNALLSNIWRGLGVETQAWEVPRSHHCNIIETLNVKESRSLDFLCP
nr:alpha/beta hydrolase [Ochrobactrum sp. CM-21-5]